jgi:hypothetical protein
MLNTTVVLVNNERKVLLIFLTRVSFKNIEVTPWIAACP